MKIEEEENEETKIVFRNVLLTHLFYFSAYNYVCACACATSSEVSVLQ